MKIFLSGPERRGSAVLSLQQLLSVCHNTHTHSHTQPHTFCIVRKAFVQMTVERWKPESCWKALLIHTAALQWSMQQNTHVYQNFSSPSALHWQTKDKCTFQRVHFQGTGAQLRMFTVPRFGQKEKKKCEKTMKEHTNYLTICNITSHHRLCELKTVMNALGFFIYIDMLTMMLGLRCGDWGRWLSIVITTTALGQGLNHLTFETWHYFMPLWCHFRGGNQI